jgi:hypothetical protein
MAGDGGADARTDADARIAALEAALAESNARNAELIEQVTKLSAQIEKLVEQSARIHELASPAVQRRSWVTRCGLWHEETEEVRSQA